MKYLIVFCLFLSSCSSAVTREEFDEIRRIVYMQEENQKNFVTIVKSIQAKQCPPN